MTFMDALTDPRVVALIAYAAVVACWVVDRVKHGAAEPW